MSKSVNVDFVTRQIEVDTDGKEHFISAAMAAKDAEASMLNAQNAANSVKKYKALWFDSVASMKAEPSLTAGAYVCTAGYYEHNDGGGAFYLIRVKTDSDVDDGGSIHYLSNGLVAELIIENGTVNVKQLGAVGDGANDDTQAFINALNIIDTVFVPDGIYKITSPIRIKTNKRLLGINREKCIIQDYSTTYAFGLSAYCGFEDFTINVKGSLAKAVILINEETLNDVIKLYNTSTINTKVDNIQVNITDTSLSGLDECAIIEVSLSNKFGVNNDQNGFYGLRINNINAVAYEVLNVGYFLKTYCKNNLWISSGDFYSCKAKGIRWGVFQGYNDSDMMFSDEITGGGSFAFVGYEHQCSNGTKGFCYLHKNGVLRFVNSIAWDWFNAVEPFTSRPYVIDARLLDVTQIQSNNVKANIRSHIEITNTVSHLGPSAFLKAKGNNSFMPFGLNEIQRLINFGILPYYDLQFLLPKIYGIGDSNHKCFLLYKTLNTKVLNESNIHFLCSVLYKSTWVNIIITIGSISPKIYQDKLMPGRFKFGYLIDSDNNFNLYIYSTENMYIGAVKKEPISNNVTGYSDYEISNNYIQTINTDMMPQSERYLETVPENIVEITDIVVRKHSNIVQSANGTLYEINVSDDGTLSTTKAYNGYGNIW